jgi:hypothetical protein
MTTTKKKDAGNSKLKIPKDKNVSRNPVISWIRTALSIGMINGLEHRTMLKIPTTTSWVNRKKIRTSPDGRHAWKVIYGKEGDPKSTAYILIEMCNSHT